MATFKRMLSRTVFVNHGIIGSILVFHRRSHCFALKSRRLMGYVLGTLFQWAARSHHFERRSGIAFTFALSPIDIVHRLLEDLEVVVFEDAGVQEFC